MNIVAAIVCDIHIIASDYFSIGDKMKDVLGLILYLGLMIFVLYFMYLGAKSRTNEIKEKREQLRQEGNLAYLFLNLLLVHK